MTIASLIVDVAANTVKLTKDTDEIKKRLDSIGSAAGTVGKALGAAFAITSIAGAAKSLIDYASHLTDLSQRTGISTTGLQKLQLAFEQNGVGIDAITTASGKLAKNLYGGDKSAIGALEKLGLSVTALKRMAPEEQFVAVADAIGKIPDPTEKSYAAMAIFGKGGAEVLAGLDGHLQETIDKFAAMGVIIDEHTIAAADDFGDQMTVLQKVGMGFIATVLGPILPQLAAMAQGLMSVSGVVSNVLVVAIKSAQTVIGLFISGFATLWSTFLNLATKIPVLGKQLTGLGDAADFLKRYAAETNKEVAKLWQETDHAGESAKKATPALIGLGELPDGPLKSLLHNLEEMDQKLTPLPGHFVLIADQAKVYGDEAFKIVQQADLMGVKVPQAVRKVAEAWNASELRTVIEKATAKWLEDLNKFNDAAEKKLRAGADRMGDAIVKNDLIMRTTRAETERIIDERMNTSTDFQIHEVERWVKSSKSNVDKFSSNFVAAFTEIDRQADVKLQAIFANESVTRMKAAAEAAGQQAEKGFTNGFLKIVQDIPSLLAQAFTNGGNLGGAVKAIGASLGSLLGEEIGTGPIGQHVADGFASIFDRKGKAAGAIAHGVSGAIQAAVSLAGSGSFGEIASYTATGASIGFMIGNGIGAGIGAGVGAIVGIIKSIGADEKQINALRESFVITSGGIDTLDRAAKQAGVDLHAFLNAKDPADYERALKSLTDAITFQDSAMNTLDETTKKYGFTLDELGPALQRQNLDKMAAQLYQDWMVLNGAGIDQVAITTRMGDSINDYFHTAMKAGIEIPASMRPMLDAMIAAGTLTDANGDKITDLSKSGVTFSETMTEGFKKVVDVVQRLTDAIARGLGLAINNLPDEKTIKINFDVEDVPKEPDNNYAARGGLVTTHGIVGYYGAGGFVPRGSDTVPAMLTPGEYVLPRPEAAAYLAGRSGRGGATVIDMSAFKAMHGELQQLRAEMASDRARQSKSLARAVTAAVQNVRRA